MTRLEPPRGFLAVPSCPGLHVTEDGAVWRSEGPNSRCVGTVNPRPNHHGYLRVVTYIAGRRHFKTIHSLVMEAYCGPRAPGLVINHIDGNKHNNHRSNLEYVTPGYNEAHATLHELKPRHERHWAAKITANEVAAIREAHAKGESGRAIARRMGLNQSTVGRILRGVTWGKPRIRAALRAYQGEDRHG